MTQKINLLLHPGLAKTATTYVQKIYKEHPDVFFIGLTRYYFCFCDEVNKLNDILFHYRYHRQLQGNSYKIIDDYASIVAKEITKRKAKNVILSDECVLGYGAYQAELNQYLLSYLFRRIEELGDFEFQNKTLLVTIRRQDSWLQSVFSAFYRNDMWASLGKDEQDLIKMLQKDPYQLQFGGLWYYEIRKMLTTIFPDFKINFVPYEELEENHDNFIKKVFNGLDVLPENMPKVEPENVNSTKIGKERINFIPELTFLGKTFFYYNPFKVIEKILCEMQKAKLLSENAKVKIYAFLAKIKDFLFYKKNPIPFTLSENAKKIIIDTYAESNKKLEKECNINLKKYGYY